MSAHATPLRMTADEFLAWVADQGGERYELFEGEPVRMAAERASHALTKLEIAFALREAVRARDLPCRVFPDGMAVRVHGLAVFEPDALLRCGPPLEGDPLVLDDPLVVVEVTSPSTSRIDADFKLAGYFRLPSLRHYLIASVAQRTVVHHARADAQGDIRTRILSAEGTLTLDPPGIDLDLARLFA